MDEKNDPDAVTLLSEMVDALDDVAKTVRDAAIAFHGMDRADGSLGNLEPAGGGAPGATTPTDDRSE